MSILYFCRGRGRGHAIPALQIARELGERAQVRFVSYGTGARTLLAQGVPVIDLGLPDDNSTVATLVHAGRLIGSLRPLLVVAHEEFAALTAAEIFGCPSVALTDFFPAAGTLWAESLRLAQEVLFLDGRRATPDYLRGRVQYMGPVLRRFEFARRDRARARRELGLPLDGRVVAVLPGSWTESRAPLVSLVSAAVGPEDTVIWLAGADAALIAERAPRFRVLGEDWQIDRLMVASDLAITKCNRVTVRELASLGVRTLSVSYGLNAPDEEAIAGLATNRIIEPRQLTARLLREVLRAPAPRPVRWRGRSVADRLREWLDLAHSAAGSPART